MPRIIIDYEFYEEPSHQLDEGYRIPEVLSIHGDYVEKLSAGHWCEIEAILTEALTETVRS